MNALPALRIANTSQVPKEGWSWISGGISQDFRVGGKPLEWRNFSSACLDEQNLPRLLSPIVERFHGAARYFNAKTLDRENRAAPFDLIVSHGPWPTAWAEHVVNRQNSSVKHFAFALNFTDLPTGLRRILMTQAFRKVDAFAVFTDAEKALYEEYFDIPPDKILRAPWGVTRPLAEITARTIKGPYIAALGGEARDYETLCETARLCPHQKFVVVARPHNFEGLETPDNVTLHFNLPFQDAWSIIQHAEIALIPLRSRETPCGLVTLVGGMHLGKAQIVTNAVGVSEYVEDRRSALLVPPKSARAMAQAITELMAKPAFRAEIGENARTRAQAEYTETATIRFFTDLLQDWFG